MEELAVIVAALAVQALAHLEGNADRFEADPGIEPLREAGPLAEKAQGIDGMAVEKAEIAGLLGKLGLAEPREDAVEEAREAPLQRPLIGAVAALAEDDRIALAPEGDELRDDL